MIKIVVLYHVCSYADANYMKIRKFIPIISLITATFLSFVSYGQDPVRSDKARADTTLRMERDMQRQQEAKDKTRMDKAKDASIDTKEKADEAKRIGKEASDASNQSKKALKDEKKAQRARERANKQAKRAEAARVKSDKNE